jgi:thiol-disulfide isomerase/thioredoxin
MKCVVAVAATFLLAAPAAAQTTIVADTRAAIDAGDLNRAETLVRKAQSDQPGSAEVLEALSWLGRGALAAKQYDRADQYARESYKASTAWLGRRKLTDAHIGAAIGNSIDVQAQVAVQRGSRSDAIKYLQTELNTYKDTIIHKRIQKTLNLLTLEGRPAPALDLKEFIGPKPPTLAQLKGSVVVYFFWAHWCPDCKIEGPILAKLYAKYQKQGLAVVAPTQRYGYGAEGAPLPPDEELRYIVRIRDQYYPFLAEVPVPTSETNHKRYGVSSTPTMVIVDQSGIIRVYHPGRMTEEELETAIQKYLAAPAAKLP